jgi:septal ring factor EnvC (AmiA/AmiB activator)
MAVFRDPHANAKPSGPSRGRLAALGAVGLVAATAGVPALGEQSGPREIEITDRRSAERAIDAARRERREAEANLRELRGDITRTERTLEGVTADLIATATEESRLEELASRADRHIARLAGEADTLATRLRGNEQTQVELLGALIAMNQRRPPALATSPGASNDAIRAAVLMGELGPALRARADEMAADLKRLQDLRGAAEAEQATVTRAEAALTARRTEIEALVTEKRALLTGLTAEAEAVEATRVALDTRVTELNALIAQLPRRAVPAPPPIARNGTPAPRASADLPPMPAALGSPTAGRLIYRYGETLATGRQSFGHIYETRPQARIVAPLSGRVVFSGEYSPVDGPSRVVMIESGDGHLVVLDGLGLSLVEEGERLTAGEPVGEMPNRTDPPPRLYFEVRRGETPLDPARWLRRAGVTTSSG